MAEDGPVPFTDHDAEKALTQGWMIFERDGRPVVQADDEQDIFDDDEQVLVHLRDLADCGDRTAARALAIHYKSLADELDEPSPTRGQPWPR